MMLWTVVYEDANCVRYEDDFETDTDDSDKACMQWLQEHPEFDIISFEEA